MKLEGTLDAFSLPEILSLLSSTRKTGALHVTRGDGRHGAVHLRDGAVTGARTQVDRQELGRRLVGTRLVDDQALDKAVERLVHEQGAGLGKVLANTASLDAATARELAAEQAVDAVFDLLRWTEGSFAFDSDEQDPDDVGASLPVEQVVAEARARLEAWPRLTATVPSQDAVVVVAPAPPGRPEVEADDWWLLALVDGHRTVGELVELSGRGEYAVVRALAGLVERDLLQVRDRGDTTLDVLQRQQALLAGVERTTAPVVPREPAAPPASAAPPVPPRPAAAPRATPRPGAAIRSAREERPVFAPPAPRSAVPASVASATSGGLPTVHGDVHGATALQPEPDGVPALPVSAHEGVDTTLLLRLIAGVRGL